MTDSIASRSDGVGNRPDRRSLIPRGIPSRMPLSELAPILRGAVGTSLPDGAISNAGGMVTTGGMVPLAE